MRTYIWTHLCCPREGMRVGRTDLNSHLAHLYPTICSETGPDLKGGRGPETQASIPPTEGLPPILSFLFLAYDSCLRDHPNCKVWHNHHHHQQMSQYSSNSLVCVIVRCRHLDLTISWCEDSGCFSPEVSETAAWNQLVRPSPKWWSTSADRSDFTVSSPI